MASPSINHLTWLQQIFPGATAALVDQRVANQIDPSTHLPLGRGAKVVVDVVVSGAPEEGCAVYSTTVEVVDRVPDWSLSPGAVTGVTFCGRVVGKPGSELYFSPEHVVRVEHPGDPVSLEEVEPAPSKKLSTGAHFPGTGTEIFDETGTPVCLVYDDGPFTPEDVIRRLTAFET